MALNSRTYRDGLAGVSGNNIVVTINDLDSLMSDNSSAILDIYSWATYTADPSFITEFSSFSYKQLLVKKTSGTVTIENTSVIQDNTSTNATIDWTENMDGNNIQLSVEITGINATVFRRGIIKMIQP